MIFELRLFNGDSDRNPDMIIVFTWWTCKGNPIEYTECQSIYRGSFQSMQLLQRHFQSRESTRDYGYGRGYEPIMVGSV